MPAANVQKIAHKENHDPRTIAGQAIGRTFFPRKVGANSHSDQSIVSPSVNLLTGRLACVVGPGSLVSLRRRCSIPMPFRESVVGGCVFRLLRGIPNPYISPREYPFPVGTAFAIVRNAAVNGRKLNFKEMTP